MFELTFSPQGSHFVCDQFPGLTTCWPPTGVKVAFSPTEGFDPVTILDKGEDSIRAGGKTIWLREDAFEFVSMLSTHKDIYVSLPEEVGYDKAR